jgi:hypothetical protein
MTGFMGLPPTDICRFDPNLKLPAIQRLDAPSVFSVAPWLNAAILSTRVQPQAAMPENHGARKQVNSGHPKAPPVDDVPLLGRCQLTEVAGLCSH